MNLHKRLLLGSGLVIVGMMSAIIMTFAYDYLAQKTANVDRLQIIFGIGGSVIGFATIAFAFVIWTNNMGVGFEKEN